MHPAKSDYIFFVAIGNGSGRHRFSSNYEEHERNVLAYRRSQQGSPGGTAPTPQQLHRELGGVERVR